MAVNPSERLYDLSRGIAKGVFKDIEPVRKISDQALIYFKDIISSRERSTWNRGHILLATQLAVTYVQVDKVDDALLNYDFTDHDNVRHLIMMKQRLQSAVIRYIQTLSLSGNQIGLSSHNQMERSQAETLQQEILTNSGPVNNRDLLM